MGSNLTPAMKRVNKEVLERDGGACVRCKNKVRADTIPHYEPTEKGDSKALAEHRFTLCPGCIAYRYSPIGAPVVRTFLLTMKREWYKRPISKAVKGSTMKKK